MTEASPKPFSPELSIQSRMGSAVFLGFLAAYFLLSRVLYLAAKPLHHDESLFGYYAYHLYLGNGYNYMPILHGPVLQWLSALFYFIFGDNKFSLRIPAVLGGLALVPAFWAWRGVLATATPRAPRLPLYCALVLLAVSPTIGYYSRFLRNDVPYLAVTVACGAWALHAFSRNDGKALRVALLLAVLMFCMMESSIFFFVACVGFLVSLVFGDYVSARASDSLSGRRLVLYRPAFAGLLAGWLVAVRLGHGVVAVVSLVIGVLFACAHVRLLVIARRPDTLAAAILRPFAGVGPRVAALSAYAVLLCVALWPTVVGNGDTVLARLAAFIVVCLSAFSACIVATQAISDATAQNSQSNRGIVRFLVDEFIVVSSWASLALVLSGYLYLRVFDDSLHVDRALTSLLVRWHEGLSPDAGLWLMVPLAYAMLWIITAIVRWNVVAPRGRDGILHRFCIVLWQQRWYVFTAVGIGIVFFQTVFTTAFTHLSDKTFDHSVRDFAGPEAPLTPLQIYKNTWDYWWDQHREHRIKGPFHYYLPILAVYEWPAILLVLVRWFRFVVGLPRLRMHIMLAAVPHLFVAAILSDFASPTLFATLDQKIHMTHPLHLHLAVAYLQVQFYLVPLLFRAGRRGEAFLTFWMATQLFAYSYAGEKVPWLTIHTAGPMLLLAGMEAATWLRRWSQFGIWKRSITATGLAAVLAFQVHSQIGACFLHAYSPRERIVFNHTSSDVEYAVNEIERLSLVTSQGDRLAVLIKGEVAWPLYWYLRDRPDAFDAGTETVDTTKRPVVICDWNDALTSNIATNYRVTKLKVREWWEPPMLDVGALADIHLAFTARESRSLTGGGALLAARYSAALLEWKRLVRYMLYRDIFLDPANEEYSNTGNVFALCVRRDLEQAAGRPDYANSLPFRREIPITR